MSKIARIIGIRAAKATVRHSAHGLACRARRRPLRSASLLGVGMAVGAGAGWIAGRRA